MVVTLMPTKPQREDAEKQGDAPEAEDSKNPRHEVWLSEEALAALEMRAKEKFTYTTTLILQAIAHYAEIAPRPRHRLLTTPREKRKLVGVPDTLWNALKKRKAATGLDLNEQVQVAVALYLERPESSADAPTQREVTPPTPDEEARLRRLMEQVVTKHAPSLFEQLLAEGKPVKRAVPALMQATCTVPITMTVSCGEGDDLDNVVTPLDNGATVDITGRLAEKVTPRSFIAKANGWSMKNEESPFDIRPGDLLLMTPIDEFPGAIKTGAIVLARVRFKDGRTVQTLKAYAGRRLKANNPAFKNIDFGPAIEHAEIIAVCRGVLEKVFD